MNVKELIERVVDGEDPRVVVEAADSPDQVKMIVVKEFMKVSHPNYGEYFIHLPDASDKLKKDSKVSALLKKTFPDHSAAKNAAQKIFKNAKAS